MLMSHVIVGAAWEVFQAGGIACDVQQVTL